MGIFDSIRKKGESTQDSEQKYAITIAEGRYFMRPPDINLWCIDNDGKVCVVVIPLIVWERMNSIITLTKDEQWKQTGSTIANAEYPQEQKRVVTVTLPSGEQLSGKVPYGVTCGCKRLYTDTPILMPVLMPEAYLKNYWISLANYLKAESSPPKSLGQRLLQNVEFIESDQTLCIRLNRRPRNLRKCDKYTNFPNGDKVEIFETYTLKV